MPSQSSAQGPQRMAGSGSMCRWSRS